MTSNFEKHLEIKWEIYKHKSGKYYDCCKLPIDYILKNITKPSSSIYNHPELTIDIIQANENYNWPWRTILSGTILDNAVNKIDIIRKYKAKDLRWCKLTLCMAESNIHDIISNKDLPWDIDTLSRSINISWDIIYNNLDVAWNWHTLSYNSAITIDIILANSQYQWNWVAVSEKNNISIDMLTKYIHFPWDWDSLTKNNCISLDEKIKHRHLPWNWMHIQFGYRNNAIICIDYPELSWNWRAVSCHINIKNIDMVMQNKHLPWVWQIISHKLRCTMQDTDIIAKLNIILDNCEMPWVYESIFGSDGVEAEMVKQLMIRLKNDTHLAKYRHLTTYINSNRIIKQIYIKSCKIQYNYLARYVHNNILIMNIFNYTDNIP